MDLFRNTPKDTPEDRLPEEERKTMAERHGQDQLLLMRLEKFEAKLEFFDNIRKALDEKMSHLSEQIGETRSMIMEKERLYSDMQATISRMEGIIEAVKSDEVIKNLEKRKKESEDIKGRVQRLDGMVETLGAEIKGMREMVERLKPLDATMRVAEDIDRKVKNIDEKSRRAEMATGKVEKIYIDLRDALNVISKLRAQADDTQRTLAEVIRQMGEVAKGQQRIAVRVEEDFRKKAPQPAPERPKEEGFFGVPKVSAKALLDEPQKYENKKVLVEKCSLIEITPGEYDIADTSGRVVGHSKPGLPRWGDIEGVVRIKEGKVVLEF